MTRTGSRIRWWWFLVAAAVVGVLLGTLVAVFAFPGEPPAPPTSFAATDAERLQTALASGDPATVTGVVEAPAPVSGELVRGLAGLRPRLDPSTITGQDAGAATVEADTGDGARWIMLVRPSPQGWRLASTAPLS